MASSEALEPPVDIKPVDPGAHQLAESSDSDDNFSDARSYPLSPSIVSPIPKTRVERVDNEPAHGEVPGTEAHRIREGDAVPDEVAVIPEQTDEPAAPAADAPSAQVIPTTVVEEAPGAAPEGHSAEFERKREADAEPDKVVKPNGDVEEHRDNVSNDDTVSPPSGPSSPKLDQAAPSEPPESPPAEDDDPEAMDDDFDDFEEGGGDDDDFDDFEDGFQEPAPEAAPAPVAVSVPQTMLPFPIPDFADLDNDDIYSTLDPGLTSLFPPEQLDLPPFPSLPKESSVFLTPRSASLWSQLVAPPPLAPPDWIRSRTRRLFLVSLGVPVDLDEILPASKQKKLVLPSLNIPSTSPRNSSESRSVSRLRQGEANASSTSVDTQGRPKESSKKRKGPPPQPELDVVAAKHLCAATDEALDGMTDEELKEHVAKLQALEGSAKEALEYWQKRTDEKIGDREAFEGVIENLVKHARKVRT